MATKLYTIRELAEQDTIGLKERVIRKLIYSGRLESINVSSGARPIYRISQEAIDKFLQANTTETPEKESI